MAHAAAITAALSAEITRYGSLDMAISALHHDADGAPVGAPVREVLTAALAQRSAERQATESTAQRIAGLERIAADYDAEAERHMAAAAAAAGEAAGRRLKGNDDEYARSFDREELNCTVLAARAMVEAERLRSQSASLRRARSYADDVVALASNHAA